jgi:hypothetical protein
MRDPFYAIDMPIRSGAFDGVLKTQVQSVNAGSFAF